MAEDKGMSGEATSTSSSQSELWQPPISPMELKTNDMMLGQMAERLGHKKKSGSPKPAITMEVLEKLLGSENLAAQDGEQKYYILPDKEALGKLLNSLPGTAGGELSQSQHWNQTNVKIDNGQLHTILANMADRLQSIDDKLQSIENLLSVAMEPSVK